MKYNSLLLLTLLLLPGVGQAQNETQLPLIDRSTPETETALFALG